MRRLILAAAFLLAVASTAGAEVRFYFVPKIGDGLSRATAFRPKYTDAGSLGVGLDLVNWSAQDYGAENVMVLGCDVTAEQHTALSAQADVLAVPANLDSTISALALTSIQNKLEAVHLPSEWVTTSMTYRQALRTLIKIVQFASRYQAVTGNQWLFVGGVTLDTRFNQLTQAVRQNLRDVAASLNLDTSGITGTMTLRQILRLIADQLPGFSMAGEAF
jgi:hypothetical protein